MPWHIFFVGMTGFEPATTRPPDAYSNRAELHPAHLRLQRYEHFTNKQDYCKKYFHQYKKLFIFFQKIIYSQAHLQSLGEAVPYSKKSKKVCMIVREYCLEVLTRFCSSCILRQSSTLIVYLYFYSTLAFMSFWAQKDQKARHRVHKSNKTLLTSCKQHPSVVLFLPLLS